MHLISTPSPHAKQSLACFAEKEAMRLSLWMDAHYPIT